MNTNQKVGSSRPDNVFFNDNSYPEAMAVTNPNDSFKVTRSGRLLLPRRNPSSEYSPCQNLRLVSSGTEYFELLERLIREAQHTIHVQTYIFDPDDTGKIIARVLAAAASRGVQVYVLVDGYASQRLSDEFINDLKNAGVHFRFFDPLLKSKYFYFGRRLHHKIVTIDNIKALVGGINISNHYNDTVDSPAWLDWALYVEGNVAAELSEICMRRMRLGVQPREPMLALPAREGENPFVDGQIRIRVNDWVRSRKEITASYLNMLRTAQSQVIIMSSYFLPGMELRRQLSKAAARGVRVRVVMGSYSDVMLSKYAERYIYRWLLKNKIEIYEYLPKVVHSKLAVCDSKWVTVGSYNVNNISAYASIELNLEVTDKNFARHVEERLERIIALDCLQVTNEIHQSRTTLFTRFLQRSAYDIIRFLLFLFTFYFKQQK